MDKSGVGWVGQTRTLVSVIQKTSPVLCPRLFPICSNGLFFVLDGPPESHSGKNEIREQFRNDDEHNGGQLERRCILPAVLVDVIPMHERCPSDTI